MSIKRQFSGVGKTGKPEPARSEATDVEAPPALAPSTAKASVPEKQQGRAFADTRAVEALTPHPLNAEIYGDACPDDLIKSVTASGILIPLIVTPENIIISGHKRWQAAKLTGLAEVPVIEKKPADESDTHLLLLEFNTGRVKTTEQILREYSEFKRIERVAAAKRKGARTDLGKNLAAGQIGRARDIAAARVGQFSATTLEMGEEILSVLRAREKSENMATIRVVLDVLNNRSIYAAHQELVTLGWVEKKGGESKSKAGGSSKSTSAAAPGVITSQSPVTTGGSTPASSKGHQLPDSGVAEAEGESAAGLSRFLEEFRAVYHRLSTTNSDEPAASELKEAVRIFAEEVLGTTASKEGGANHGC